MAPGKRKAPDSTTKRTTSRKKANRPPRTRKQKLKRLGLWALVTAVVMGLVGVGAFYVVYRSVDIPNPNEEFLTETTSVYYAGGKAELGEFAVQKRDSIDYEEMPQTMKDAVVAAENRTFWTDRGIDPKGIVRAAFSNAAGGSTQGASTITQQYVKILYLTQERTWKRKSKEAILSLKIRNQLSKQDILEGYLNTIYFGRGAYGIQAAAQAYFDRDAKDLNLRQSTALAAILNNPSLYDPANGEEAVARLQTRMGRILDGMVEMGTADADEAEAAAAKLPKFPKIEQDDQYAGQRGHVLQMVRKELLRLGFTEEEIQGGGLQVTTTFTRKAMDAAEQGVKEARPEGFGKNLHVAVASVEPGTGAVRGIYGGHDYLDSQINWAVAGGQAGSTFKPFAVAAGLKSGYSLKDTFDGNSPYVVGDADFENQGDRDYGRVSLLQATENSINTAFINMTEDMPNGPEEIIRTANAMGVPPAEPARDPYGFPTSSPGLNPEIGVSLGSQTVSPINMANGYATIANGGAAADAYIIEKVVDRDGVVRFDHKVTDRRAISEDIAADTSYAMETVVRSGTGTGAQAIGRPAAGKTGTATKDGGAVSSAWFAGFTPQLSTAVMYVRGKGNGQLDGWLPTFFGSGFPLDTWNAVMSRALEGEEVLELADPAYVDGDAPESGHEPYTPPPSPSKKPKPKPKQSKTTQKPETSAPPTTEAPTPTETKTDKTPPPLVPSPSDSESSTGAAQGAATPKPRQRRRRTAA
ncbi:MULTISPECIES: transglycosylase domain-containing protein [Nocardioides]|uniref:Transglycosylase domain-containing protein n=1 Tax=Nocardioides vastitatis TaxID=2568655 RepID=A0ABW0ZJQ7_9ACTN|nr:transglycosylase domain-containing protein [Nocardioides sp.]